MVRYFTVLFILMALFVHLGRATSLVDRYTQVSQDVEAEFVQDFIEDVTVGLVGSRLRSPNQ